MNRVKAASSFFYLALVRGVPGANFKREFANNLVAESLRSRYRVVVFCLGLGPSLVTVLVDAFCLITRMELPGPDWLWLCLMFNPVTTFGADLELAFVRFVLKRRTRLDARSYPHAAERLLWLFLPPETCEEAIDDINARFEKLKGLHDTGFARRWYWWQVVRSVSPTLDLFIERLVKWGFWSWIGSHFWRG